MLPLRRALRYSHRIFFATSTELTSCASAVTAAVVIAVMTANAAHFSIITSTITATAIPPNP
jgi:hypothetical protein